MALKQEQVLFRNGFDIGIGVAMASGSPMALGATGAITPPEVGTGGSGSFTFRRVETNEDLETELGIGADVSAGIGLFSGSASFDFSRKCKIQSSSLTVLVSAEERFAFQQMDSPELSKAAAELVDNGQLGRFADQFGEYFIRGISSGGRFLGVVRIDTDSIRSKTEVDAALSASYGLTVSGEVKTRISETMSRANARAEAFILFDGGEVTTRPTSADPVELLNQLYKAMDEWTATVRTSPKAYSVTLAPYIIALGPMPPNIAQLERQRDVLIRCAKLRSATLDKLNLIDYMLDPKHSAEFKRIPPPDGPDLPALQAALAGDLDVIAEAASFAINNLKKARQPEAFMREIKGVADFAFTELPLNLPEHTGGPVVLPTVRVPDMRGVEQFELEEAARCLDRGTVDDCLAGVFTGQGEVPLPIRLQDREVVEFVKLTRSGGPSFRLQIPPSTIPGASVFRVLSQVPAPGTLVTPDDEVVLQFVEEAVT